MRCSSCKEEKSEVEFNWRNKSLGKRQDYCRECKRTQQRKYYQNNREAYLATSSRGKKARNEKYRTEVIKHLQANPCVDCGETDFRCLQFDHVRGDKVAPVSVMLDQGASLSRIFDEITKCEVRCANCHWKVTAERAGWYAYLGPVV